MSKLSVMNVAKRFGRKKVLEYVDLELETGHCYALLGRNGAGKSTLLQIILQNCSYQSGKILLDGRPVRNDDRQMRRMFCMSDRAVYPADFRLKTIFAMTKAMYPGFDLPYAQQLAARWGLDTNMRVGRLSTGYNTLYKVILALASNAEFVFFDEPVLGIDVNQREAVYRELAGRFAQTDACFVISTHLIEEMQNLADRVIILHEGRIMMAADTDELLGGYITVSGTAEAVERFAADHTVLHTENMSVFRTVLVKGSSDMVPEGLTCESGDLQKLFYCLTGGAPDGAEESR